MAKFVEVHKVGKTYTTLRGPAVIVRDFTVDMREGEVVALLGHSGCGKSTVLSMIAGLTDSSAGAIIVAGREVTEPGPERAVVFQSPCLLKWLTALENVLLAVQPVFSEASPAEQREIASYYLSVVGLGHALHKRPGELSQGMQQRVGIARAFAVAPKMLLLDEPFGMLDSLTRMELQEVLLELLQRDRKTALLVTHDIDEALFMADRVVMMTNGPAATVGKILATPFERPRDRADVLAHNDYYPMRGEILAFLEDHTVKRVAG